MTKVLTNNITSLLEEKEARAFLKKALDISYSNKTKVNYSDFSKKAGFQSRSYLGELLRGKKGFSRASLIQIKRALELPRPYKRYFELLALQNFPHLRLPSQSPHAIKNEIASIRDKILNPAAKSTLDNVENHIALLVYAALGSPSTGTTLEKICQKTGLEKSKVTSILNLLLKEGAVAAKDGHYYPTHSYLDFIGSQTKSLKSILRSSLKEMSQTLHFALQNNRNLFFYSAFSVRKQDIPEIRCQLREAVLSLLDRYQCDEGSDIQQLFVGFYK